MYWLIIIFWYLINNFLIIKLLIIESRMTFYNLNLVLPWKVKLSDIITFRLWYTVISVFTWLTVVPND